MAELVVKAQYTSKTRILLLGLLKATFPLWGIAAPMAGLICLAIFIGSLHQTYMESMTLKILIASCQLLAIAALSLLATRALSHDRLIADKNGIQLPLMLGGWRRHQSWKSIAKITIKPQFPSDKSKQSLVFIPIDGKSAVGIKLSRLAEKDIEQLLLAIEMWAPEAEKDASFRALKENLRLTNKQATEGSYTEMWEEELRRRFCATAFMPLEPGVTIRQGTLKVVRPLALGGLSALYLCQLSNNKLVVLKEAVIPDDSTAGIKQKALEMFEREAKLLSKLNHPNIVKVMDYFVDNARHYLMLEHVNGQDLRQFTQQNGCAREPQVVDWAIQTASILKYLHEQNPPIIHRDLTPDNLVQREDGTIVLIDFGAANEFLGKATGTFVGKQAFIAPEQFRGKAVVQSDIYALGCTMHYLLTGKEPEALSTSSPKTLNSQVGEELNEVVVSCTQIEPQDRYRSAAQLLPVLKRLAATMFVS